MQVWTILVKMPLKHWQQQVRHLVTSSTLTVINYNPSQVISISILA